MIAEDIHRLLGIRHQLISGVGLGNSGNTTVAGIAHGIAAGGAGADDHALGIVFPYPADKEILVTGKMLGQIVGGCAVIPDIGFIHKFRSSNRHTVFLAQREDLLRFAGIPGIHRNMQTLAVGNGDHQLAAHGLDKVQNTDPLFFGQCVQIPLGSLTAHFAVKIIVSAGCPGAGNTDPHRAEFACQIPQPGIIQINGREFFHEFGADLIETLTFGKGKFFRAGHLSGRIGLPEGTTCDFCHFHVVGHQAGVYCTKEC